MTNSKQISNLGKKNNLPVMFEMVFTAILVGLICLMTFSGIGFIPIGPFRLTILTLPVAVGSVILGPRAGFILGAVFGLASFVTCFGMDPLGSFLLGINPFYTFLFCVIPRIICGIVPAFIFKAIKKFDKTQVVASGVCCLLTALLNTVLFLSFLWILFANEFLNNPDLISLLGGQINNIFVLFTAFAGTNAVIEAITGLVLGSAICKALLVAMKKFNK